MSLVSLFPDGDIAPSYCGHRGLAGPEGEGPGLLMDCKEQVVLPAVGEGGLKFEVTGLEYMNDDPGEVDVLYAGVKDESGTLRWWRG